jgi:hypothetical protein
MNYNIALFILVAVPFLYFLCATEKSASSQQQKLIDCCERWLNYEEEILNLTWAKDMERELPCPCSVDEVMAINKKNFVGGKNVQKWTAEHSILREYSFFFKLARYHPGAVKCYRSPYKNIHGQQCCYDKHDFLITDGPGGGTADKGLATLDFVNLIYSVIVSPIYTQQHKRLDVYPFLDCGGSSGWEIYKKYRPISNGNNRCEKNKIITNMQSSSSEKINSNIHHLYPNSYKVEDEKFCNWQPLGKDRNIFHYQQQQNNL